MSMSWQKNSQTDLLGAWSDISSFQIDPNESLTLAISEDEGKARHARLWIACYENKSPADSENIHGKELATDGWIEAKEHAGSTWQAVTFPTSFPAAIADLDSGEGALSFDIAASGRTLIDFRLVVPAGAASSGLLLYALVMRCWDA